MTPCAGSSRRAARRLVLEALRAAARVRVDLLDRDVRQLRLAGAADQDLEAAARGRASQDASTSSIATFQ
jgi:hypothetical protein